MTEILMYISLFILIVSLLTPAEESPKWSLIVIAMGVWANIFAK